MKLIKLFQLTILFATTTTSSFATHIISLDHYASTSTTHNIPMVFDNTTFQQDYKTVFRLVLKDASDPIGSIQHHIRMFHYCDQHNSVGVKSVDRGTTYRTLGAKLVSDGSVAFVGTHIEFTHTCRLYSIVPEVAAAYGSMGDYYFKRYEHYQRRGGLLGAILGHRYLMIANDYYDHQLHHLGQ